MSFALQFRTRYVLIKLEEIDSLI